MPRRFKSSPRYHLVASRCKVHGETYKLYNRSIGVLGSSILHEATMFFDRVMELDIRYEEYMEYEALGGSRVQLD